MVLLLNNISANIYIDIKKRFSKKKKKKKEKK